MLFHRRQLPYENTVLFQGQKINYRLLGTKKNPKVVMVHGAMESRDWEKFEDEASKYFYAYVIDLPGFGGSDHIPNTRYTVNLLSDALGAFLKNLGLEAAPIIALSMGTLVTTLAAAKGYTHGKLLLGGMPFEIPGGKADLANRAPLWLKRFVLKINILRQKILIPILDSTLNETYAESPEVKLAQMASTHHHTISDIDLADETKNKLPKYFTEVKNPSLFMYGENDPLQNAARTKGVKFIIIPKAEHNLYRTNPEAAIKTILNFLKN